MRTVAHGFNFRAVSAYDKLGECIIILERVRDSDFWAFVRHGIPYKRAFVWANEGRLKAEQLDAISLAQIFGPRVGRPAWRLGGWLLQTLPSPHYATNEVRKLRVGPPAVEANPAREGTERP